jgi:hypothetical protein
MARIFSEKCPISANRLLIESQVEQSVCTQVGIISFLVVLGLNRGNSSEQAHRHDEPSNPAGLEKKGGSKGMHCSNVFLVSDLSNNLQSAIKTYTTPNDIAQQR